MPNIYINGTLIPNGASSISYSNPITLSWDGLDSDSYYAQYNTYVEISARDASNTYADLSFSGNTGVSDPIYAYFDRYGDISDYASFAGYMQVGSSGSVSITFSKDIQGGTITVDVVTTGQIVQQSDISVLRSDPDITKQPVLSLGSSSGASVNMTWSAAEVSYADGATIYYQYFVGPSSSYSDSYHIGTTTGLSHTMTEAEIISKCGNGFGASSSGSVCYLFVRAYWQKGSATGGWSTPTGVAFTYFPTINAPTNSSLTPAKGKTTSISWTNRLAGNNSQPQSILRRKSGGSWVNIAAGILSVYTVPESVWKALGKGTYELCIAHEWYGRYANGSSMYFEYSPDNTVRIDGDDCVAYLWDETQSAWKPCDPYIWDEGSMEWVLCSTT